MKIVWNYNFSIHVFSILVFSILVGCVAAPVQEMSDARQAIEAAHAVGASEGAPKLMKQAQDLLQKAEEDLDEGDFEQAREHAAAAKRTAMKARTDSSSTGPDHLE